MESNNDVTNRKLWVYDLEQLVNFHSGVFINVDTDEIKVFYLHDSVTTLKNIQDYKEFLLNEVKGLIGFNSKGYDSFLIDKILTAKNFFSVSHLISMLYKEGNRVIQENVTNWKPLIPDQDLFRMMHFNNKARSTSLKALQVAMKWYNVQDMPIHHSTSVTEDMIDDILSYNKNDTLSTRQFYTEVHDLIDLRRQLSHKYNKDLFSADDPKMGTEIFMYYLSRHLGIPEYKLRKMQTRRLTVDLKDCVIDGLRYNSDKMNREIIDYYSNMVITTNVNNPKAKPTSVAKDVVYKGFKYSFGAGGIHGGKRGIFEADDNHIIRTVDVESYYPNLSIKNGFYPEHLGKRFCDVYESIFEERKLYPKKTHFAFNYAYKIALNGTFGKSGDQYSPFLDHKFLYQITINGQILLTMLSERLQDAGFEMIMINTDGMEFKILKNRVELFDNICKEWEKETKLNLEYDEYKALYIRDVNNYIGLFSNDSVKLKGDFEIDKQWHKDPSFRIVPIAVKEYFVNKRPIERVINGQPFEFINDDEKEITDHFDYMGRYKGTKKFTVILNEIENNSMSEIKLSKTVRYYITKRSKTLYKVSDKSRIAIESGWNTQPMNLYDPKHDFKFDLKYYRKAARKLIETIEIEHRQQRLL